MISSIVVRIFVKISNLIEMQIKSHHSPQRLGGKKLLEYIQTPE